MSSPETPTASVVTMRAADFSGHNSVSDTELSSLHAFSYLILQEPHGGDASFAAIKWGFSFDR